MAPVEARQIIVEDINYAAYRETDYSLYDSDENRLFGSLIHTLGRIYLNLATMAFDASHQVVPFITAKTSRSKADLMWNERRIPHRLLARRS